MDWKLLETWGVEKNSNLREICDVLEERQLELLQMRRSATDPKKKSAIADELKNLEGQLKQAKKEIRKQSEGAGNASAGAVSDATTSEADKMAEMKKKLDALKKQEEIRRKEEEARTDILAADNTSSTADNASGPQSAKPSHPAQAVRTAQPRLQSGIVEFRNGNYGSAFVIFNGLAQKGDPEAEYYLSQLFHKGLGTDANSDKANFWLKRSADHKYAEAQYAYAMRLLSNRSGTDQLPEAGMQYLAKAADQDFQPASKQYVDLVLKGYHELPAVKNAIQYASRLQSSSSDQYEINVYKNKEEQLKSILTEGKKRESSGKVLRAIGSLSSVLLIFGFLYLLGGAHPNEWNSNALLSVFPNASAKLIVPLCPFWMLTPLVLTVNGRFGLEMITLAYACRSFYAAKEKARIKGALSAVSKVIIAAIVVWHLLLVIIEDQSLDEGIINFIIALIVCRIFGLIFGKLANTVSNSKSVVKGIVWVAVIIAVLVAINKFLCG